MAGIFDILKVYQGRWEVAKTTSVKEELGEKFTLLESLEIVPSEYGISVKFTFKGGYYQYIPVSTECETLEIGEQPNVENLVILTLHREGDDDIFRINTK